MAIQKFLKKQFGFDSFRPGQQEVIEDVLRQKNQIAILPTGSGKSLCYQLPAYFLNGTVLVISPLVALMEDQVAILKQQGEKRVAALNSFYSFNERAHILTNLEQYKFVFISPEMLSSPYVVEKIRKITLAFIVVDEAHCISQWGFDFRPDYLRLNDFIKSIDNPTILALTATANEKVIRDISNYLNMYKPSLHIYSLDRPNVSYSIQKLATEENKTNWLINRLEKTTGPGIIYVASRKRADVLAHILKEKGVAVSAYHAGMEQEDRAFVQAQFLTGETEWICATNAFGMGIHKEDVRQVIHEHIPTTIANYTQEIGRAGRDGNQSIATLIFTDEDINKARFITHEDYPKEEEVLYFSRLLTEEKSNEEAAKLTGLSETGRRMLTYYFERMSIQDTIKQIKQQSIEKEAELQKMTYLVNSERCIREQILSFFGQQLDTKPAVCCGNCHEIQLEPFKLVAGNDPDRKWSGWIARLDELLGAR